MQFIINSLNNSVTNWLYKRRMEITEIDLPIEEDVEKEWVCLKTIVQRAAEEALGKRSSRQNHKKLKIWNDKLSREVKRKQNLF